MYIVYIPKKYIQKVPLEISFFVVKRALSYPKTNESANDVPPQHLKDFRDILLEIHACSNPRLTN